MPEFPVVDVLNFPVVDALDAAYAAITDVVAELSDSDVLLASGCRGWTVADLLLHVTGDAQRALVALHTPADGPADADFVSYWRAFPTGDDRSANAQWVRRTAAAFARPAGVVAPWRETSAAARHAARTADLGGFVGTQGHVLAVPDFLATLVTEAAIHHLDLVVSLPGAPGPPAEAVAIAVSTLAGLAGAEGLPAGWSPVEALRKGAGRAELTAAEAAAFGDRFPLLG